MKQYMPKKPIKGGFKIWIRADISNGYVCQLQCYTGKEGNTTEVGLGGSVVTTLTRELVGKNYNLYFFSSIHLFQRLLDDNIHATGTLRSNRKMFPPELVTVAKRSKVKMCFCAL